MRLFVKAIFRAIVMIAVMAVFSGMLVVGLFEWAHGCGQVIHLADGTTRQGECIYLTWLNE